MTTERGDPHPPVRLRRRRDAQSDLFQETLGILGGPEEAAAA